MPTHNSHTALGKAVRELQEQLAWVQAPVRRGGMLSSSWRTRKMWLEGWERAQVLGHLRWSELFPQSVGLQEFAWGKKSSESGNDGSSQKVGRCLWAKELYFTSSSKIIWNEKPNWWLSCWRFIYLAFTSRALTECQRHFGVFYKYINSFRPHSSLR